MERVKAANASGRDLHKDSGPSGADDDAELTSHGTKRVRSAVKTRTMSMRLMSAIKKKKKSATHPPIISVLIETHHQHSFKYVIEPFDRRRRIFDAFTVAWVIYLAWKIPFAAGIDWYVTPKPMKYYEYFLDAWFAVDIILNFRTGFVHDGHVVMDPKEIAKHYFHFWFWIDILASIPFEMFSGFISDKTTRKSIKLVKYFKIPRLLRLGRLLKYLRKYAKYYGIVAVTLGYFLGTHMTGCMWVNISGICASEAELHIDGDQSLGYIDPEYDGLCHQDWVGYWYLKGFHVGVMMMMGGSPVNMMLEEQRQGLVNYEGSDGGLWFYSSFCMTFGLFFVGAFIAQITVIFSHSNQSMWNYRKKMDAIKAEMAAHHLNADLQYRVKKYLDYIWINKETLGKSVLLNDPQLSLSLRYEVALHMSKKFLAKISWLQVRSFIKCFLSRGSQPDLECIIII